MLVLVYTCQNATMFEITCRCSIIFQPLSRDTALLMTMLFCRIRESNQNRCMSSVNSKLQKCSSIF